MNSPFFLKKKIPLNPVLHLVEPSSIVPFDIHPIHTIKVQSSKAQQSLNFIESTFRKYNLNLHSAHKNITEELERQYPYLKKIYEEVVLVSRMNFALKDQIVISLCELLSKKEKKKKPKTVNKNYESGKILGEEEQNIINSKMSPTYVRMNFLPINSRQKLLNKTSSTVLMSDIDNKLKQDRKNRLYGGSTRITSRKQYGIKSTHSTQSTPSRHSKQGIHNSLFSFSQSNSLNNSKLMWNWNIKHKCSQFSTHTNSSTHLQKKSFQREVKLINNGYINKDIFNKDISFKKKRKYNNAKSRNIYNGKNTDIMVMQIL